MLKAILVKGLERKEGNFRKRTYPKHIRSFTTQKENQHNVFSNGQKISKKIIFFYKVKIQMVHKQMKRCSSPLANRKMQKKTILRYHHIPIFRMAEMKHMHTKQYKVVLATM